MKRLLMPWLAWLLLAGGCETDRQPAFVEPWDTLPRLEGIALNYARANHIDFDFPNSHSEAGTKETTDVAYIYFCGAKDQPYYRFKIARDGQVLQAGLMVPASVGRKPDPQMAMKPPGPEENGTIAAASPNAPAPAAPPAPAQAAVQANVETQPATASPAAAGTAPGAAGTNVSPAPKPPPHSTMTLEHQFAGCNCALTFPSGYEKVNYYVPEGFSHAEFFGRKDRSRAVGLMLLQDPYYGPLDEGFAARVEKRSKKSLHGYGRLAGRRVVVGGIDGYEKVFMMDEGGQLIPEVCRWVCVDGQLYQLMGVVSGGDVEAASTDPEILAVLDSFRFLKPPGSSATPNPASAARMNTAAFRTGELLGRCFVVVAILIGAWRIWHRMRRR